MGIRRGVLLCLQKIGYHQRVIMEICKGARLAKLTRIHVNQHQIRRNGKMGTRAPVLTCKTYKSNVYAHEVIILDKDGEETARVAYRPDKPLSCGARVWVETRAEVVIVLWGDKGGEDEVAIQQSLIGVVASEDEPVGSDPGSPDPGPGPGEGME